jgi:hypothetical protein
MQPCKLLHRFLRTVINVQSYKIHKAGCVTDEGFYQLHKEKCLSQVLSEPETTYSLPSGDDRVTLAQGGILCKLTPQTHPSLCIL